MKNEFIYPLRVHIEDTDCTGLVYHANYFNFMERARSEWMDEWGVGMLWQKEQGLLFVLHSANIQFLKPVHVHESIEVVSIIKSIRTASLIFDQRLRFSAMPDKILCKAEIKLACVGFNLQPRALPQAPFFEMIRRI